MNEIRPAIVRAAKRTIAGTGFRIDQAEMLRKFMTPIPWSRRSGACRGAHGNDLVARIEEGAGRSDYAFAAVEARHDADAAVVHLADLHVASHHSVVGADRI